MHSQTVITFCYGLVCLLSYAAAETNKVKVTVYYESLCPDSKKFINTQLYPALTNNNGSLAAHVDLTLVPFGKAKFVYDNQFKSYNFSCHHGEDECTGNKIHACGLKRIVGGQDKGGFVTAVALDFVNCVMANVDRSKTPAAFPTRECATKSRVTNLAEVENCAHHVDGQTYLANYGTDTDNLNPALTSVPTIVFNDENTKANSDAAQTNFVSVLCRYLGKMGDKPEACNATGASSGLLMPQYVFVLVASVFAFLWQWPN